MQKAMTADNATPPPCYTMVYCPFITPCGKKACEMGDKKCPAIEGYQSDSDWWYYDNYYHQWYHVSISPNGSSITYK